MKYLLIFLLVFAMLFSVGCFITPEPEPDEPVETPIVCEGGHYVVHYIEWSPTGCEGEDYPAGTFWHNEDGRVFWLGDVVWPLMPVDVYGICPTEYIEELLL